MQARNVADIPLLPRGLFSALEWAPNASKRQRDPMKTNTKPKDRPRSTSTAKPRTENPEPAKATRKSGGGSELKTRQELAQALGYSVRTLDRLTAAKVIPHIRTGRLVRYRLESVLSALQRNCEIKEVAA